MAKIEPFEEDLDILQKLDDVPGLTAKAMQAEFDKSGNIIKNFLNNVIIPAINSIVAVTGTTDKTLSIDGAPADSLEVGSRLSQLVNSVSTGLASKIDKSGGVMAGKLSGIVTPTAPADAANKQYVDAARLIFKDVEVPARFFEADTTYEDYGFKANIPLSAAVTASMIPDVVFPVTDISVCPVAESYNGGVTVWADESKEMTIPTIIMWRGDIV